MQTEQRNSLRLLQWMMAASLALPLALFIFASAVSYVSIQDTADREIERTLDVAHEHALKVFETIDRSLSEINEMISGIADADIKSREQAFRTRLKQLVDSLPQMKSAWVFDAQGHALVNSLVFPAPDHRFFGSGLFQGARSRRIPGCYRRCADPAPALSGSSVLQRQPPPAYRGRQLRRRRPGLGTPGIFREFLRQDRPRSRQLLRARPDRRHGAGALSRGSTAISGSIATARRDKRSRPSPAAGLVTVTSPADGIERRLGYQRLAEYPLYVSAGLETSAIRARWLATMSQHLIFGVPATALLFLILSLALRRTRRLYANRPSEWRPRKRSSTASGWKRWASSPAGWRMISTICSP